MSQMLTFPVARTYTCDVLVVGGGVSGISAAICAARMGVSVLLAERDGCLGGTASVGLVGPFMSCFDPTGTEQVIRGFLDEFIQRMVQKGGAIHPRDCAGGDSYSAYRIKGHIGVTPFDAECLKMTAEEMCEEAGVKLLYHMLLCQCRTDETGSIQSAFFMTKNGVYEVQAKVFLDCTGDADLAVMSGAPTVYGDKTGRTQVSSIFFLIDGVNKQALEQHIEKYPEATHLPQRYFEDIVAQAQLDGSFPCGRSRVSAFEGMKGIWRVNMTQYDKPADFSDPEDVTRAEIACRKQIFPIMDFLKNHVPGFEHIRLLQSAQSLGIRESRRIIGDHTLTMEDLSHSTSFPDAICVVGSAVDFHGSFHPDGSYDGAYYVTGTKAAQIPLRCLIPQNVNNLLVAGRAISADQMAHSAVRVMPPCIAMGQAAGTAAGLAVSSGKQIRQIDITQLQRVLRQNGVYLPETDPG